MRNRTSKCAGRDLVAILALVVAFGSGSASASNRAPSATTAVTATIAIGVLAGSYAGEVEGVPAAVAVIAEAPSAAGQPRTISIYVCNGTALSVWLTGRTMGNTAVLESADRRYHARVSVTLRTATGVLAIPGGSQHWFSATSTTLVSGLFDVTVAQDGTVTGRSTTGATLTGRIGAAGVLPAEGTVTATASSGGKDMKLTVLARHLTPGAYRWIVLSGGKVYGANKQSVRAGGVGGLVLPPLTGTRVARIKSGSAGIKGWSNARCQGLANQWDKLVGSAGDDIAKGKDASADSKLTKAQGMLDTLTSNCFTTGIG